MPFRPKVWRHPVWHIAVVHRTGDGQCAVLQRGAAFHDQAGDRRTGEQILQRPVAGGFRHRLGQAGIGDSHPSLTPFAAVAEMCHGTDAPTRVPGMPFELHVLNVAAREVYALERHALGRRRRALRLASAQESEEHLLPCTGHCLHDLQGSHVGRVRLHASSWKIGVVSCREVRSVQ